MTGQADNDFIEEYPDALDAVVCREMIAAFNASAQRKRGATSGGVDTTLKDSWDLCISDHPQWAQGVSLLNSIMMRGLKAYVRKYPMLALAPTVLRRHVQASGESRMLGAHELAPMQDAALEVLLVKLFRPGTINLQKYLADEGGYPYWHCEIAPRQGDETPLHRVLLWSLYLNDDFAGGETEFLHQQRKIVPRTGSLLLAPAGFTHTHRGNMPRGGDKYIATSWVLFQPAEKLYHQQEV